jgi:hypothetical protein
LKLLKNAGKWEQLRFYLQAAVDSDADLADRAIEMISRWLDKFNCSFARATTSDLENCGQLFEAVRRGLPPPRADQLAFILKTSA